MELIEPAPEAHYGGGMPAPLHAHSRRAGTRGRSGASQQYWLSVGNGLIAPPPVWISKCRCGALAFPVMPT
jgi:hypothetical protein